MINFVKTNKKIIIYYAVAALTSALLSLVLCSLFFYDELLSVGHHSVNIAFICAFALIASGLTVAAVLLCKKPNLRHGIKEAFTVFEKQPFAISSAICGALVFVLIFVYTARMPLDYNVHTLLAVSFDFSDLANSLNENSYPLWHIFVKLFSLLLPIPDKYCAALTSALFVLFTYRISEKLIKELSAGNSAKVYAPFFAAALMFVQPIYIPWFNKEQVIGQGTPNVFYNPTSLVAKPFAIICVYLVLKLLIKHRTQRISTVEYLRLSVFALLSVIAKPSAIQVVLPTLAVFLLVYLIYTKGKAFSFCVKLMLSWIPALLWMAAVFYLSFVSQTTSDGNGIALSFFDVWRIYSPCIPISILLASLFPLAVLLVCGKKGSELNKLGTLFGVLSLLIGIFEYGFIMETGDRMRHGNFSWGYIISLGVFWTFATSHLLSLNGQKVKKLSFIVLLSLFAVHLIFGAYYFVSTI